MSRLTSLRSTMSPKRTLGLVAVAATAVLGLSVSGSALADTYQPVPAPPAVPTAANQIQNIDQVKTAIKGYYGDTVTSTMDPVNGTTALHTFSPTGSYAQEMASLVSAAETKLAQKVYIPYGTQKAVLFDVDDTLLNTYNYEIYSNFVYNPTSNAAFVNNAAFPAVPHMVELEQFLEAHGYAVYFLTGRPESQRAGTITNLTNAGFDVTDSHLYLKDLTKPIYSSCAPTCTTTQYKSLTRKYIQSQKVELVANFGDQYSDLNGGYADQTYKIPNPMYYLP